MTLPRVSVFAVALSLLGVPALARAAEPTIRFNRDIRPILSDKCFACHGPDATHVKGDLRLDLRDSAIKANKDGRIAIVPGDAAASELVRRITSNDPKRQMPPPDLHKPLDADEIDTLRRWVAAGAEYEPHWSYAPLQRPQPPAVKDASWPASEIDRFVLARIEDAGAKPSPDADRVMLIRRLTLDLTGLPPTPAEIDAFVADTSADAYEKLVDRLLASPHYGERMAAWWLDLARYADSNGYHGDNPRQMWLYRDYVIGAFNSNKPFDRFTVEQIAGDLLPDATREQRIASAYNRLLQTTQEGGAQAKEYYAKYVADRVRNTATAFLGSTLGCAECHNHKFDPFTAKDFYAFGAFFADINEQGVGSPKHTKMPTAEQQAAVDAADARIAELNTALATQTPQLDAELAKWEREIEQTAVQWTTLDLAEVKSAGGATFTRIDDGSYLASGANPDKDTYTVAVPLTLKGVTAIRLEAMPDDSLPAKGPGRASNGNFVLKRFTVKAGDAEVKVAHASATFEQKEFGAAGTIGTGNGWAIHPRIAAASEAWFELAADLGDLTPPQLTIVMEMNHGSSHSIGRFRLSATTAPRPVRTTVEQQPPPVAAILQVPADQRTEQQKAALAAHFRTIAPSLDPVRAELAALQKQRVELVKPFPELVITLTLDKPREIRVLPRGNWLDDTGEVVQPAIPEFLGKLDTAATDGAAERRATRLDLANWIVAPDNPLTARVLVNRLWMLMFGHALARNPYDIGSQGPWPSHPQLIDWLAADLIAHGWDVKRTMKMLAMTRTYRQSSIVDDATRTADPYNTHFARQTVYRLDAESVRDSALAISGLLKPDIGGPSVFPYQPPGYWQHLKFPARSWKNDTGDKQHRRGLYTWWQRTFLHPSMLAFDAPSREECVAQRTRSNTPLQSLTLLNDPTYLEAARKFAERIIKEGGDGDGAKLGWAMRQATGRAATPAEIAVLADVLAAAREEYAQPEGDAAAKKLLAIGQTPRDESLDARELAAWTQAARTVLNLHEVITRN